jgi:hypothetical protein
MFREGLAVMDTTPRIVTNSETGSTVPPPPLNRRYRRGLKSSKPANDAEKALMNPEAALHQLRAMLFQRAAETLTILAAIRERCSVMDPLSAEINEGLELVGKAYVETGLQLVRPVLEQLRVLQAESALKLVAKPADIQADAGQTP